MRTSAVFPGENPARQLPHLRAVLARVSHRLFARAETIVIENDDGCRDTLIARFIRIDG